MQFRMDRADWISIQVFVQFSTALRGNSGMWINSRRSLHHFYIDILTMLVGRVGKVVLDNDSLDSRYAHGHSLRYLHNVSRLS